MFDKKLWYNHSMKCLTKNILIHMLLFIMVLLFVSCASEINENDLIPVDDSVIEGVLQNGMKYYIYPTDDEPDSAYIQVTIKTGSLYESDDERGLSHYIEHMAFNSTEKYNRDEFRTLENELGISFGAHSNAYTSADTVNYNISFQNPSASRLEKIFDIMSQRTIHMVFDSEEVDLERGVVLSEKQLSDSNPSYTEYLFQYDTILQGSSYPSRSPIGTQAVIENATPDQLKALYEKWYTPKRIAVSMIGDIDTDTVHTMMEKYFGAVEGKQEWPEPNIKSIPPQDTIRYHTYTNPSRVSNTLEMVTVLEDTTNPQSVLSIKNMLTNDMLSSYIDKEFQAYLKYKKYDSALLSLYSNTGDMEEKINLKEYFVSVSFMEGKLPEAMEEVQYFLSVIYENLQDEETIKNIKKDFGKTLLKEWSFVPKGNIQQTANYITSNFIYGFPIMDVPKTLKKYGKRALHSISQDDFLSVFETQLYQATNKNVFLLLSERSEKALKSEQKFESFGLSALFDRAYTIDGDISFSSDKNEDAIKAVLEDILDVQAGKIIDESVFIHTDVAADTKKNTETNVYQWKLNNGFSVVFQQVVPNDKKEKQFAMLADNINFYYNFVKRKPNVSSLLFDSLEYTSYEDILLEDLYRNDMFSKSAIDYWISENVTVETQDTKEIESVFKLFHTIYKTISVQPSGFERAKQQRIIFVKESILDSNTFAWNELFKYLRSGYAFNVDEYDFNTTEQVSLDEVIQYKDAFLGTKDTVVYISGNIDPKKVKQYAEQWIASIPTSASYPIDDSYEHYTLPNKTHTKTITRKDNNDIASIMYGAFRRLDETTKPSIQSKMIDSIASAYITEKIEKRVREELGDAYYVSAFISSHQSIIAPEQLFLVEFPTKPTNAESLKEELTTILQTLIPVSNTSLDEQKAIASSNIQERFNEPNVMSTLYSLRRNANSGLPLYSSEADMLTAIDTIHVDDIESRIKNVLEANSFSFVFLPSKDISLDN